MDTINQLKTLIASILKIDDVHLDIHQDISEIEKWDSMMNMIILSSIEEQFGIMIPEEDLFDLVNIQAIADEIDKIRNNKDV